MHQEHAHTLLRSYTNIANQYVGVELLLNNDLSNSCSLDGVFPPPGSRDAGSLVQRGLKVLSDSPTEALGVKRGDDLTTIRKAYKKYVCFNVFYYVNGFF